MKKLLQKILLTILILTGFSGSSSYAAFPTTFATLTGNQPLTLLDTMFGVVGSMGQVMCTAAGTNTIALTPNTNMPTVSNYANYQEFGFVAPNTTTGSVTINVSSIGAKNVYAPDGVTQIGSGGFLQNAYYVVIYNSALNSSSGGFQLITPLTSSTTGTVSSGTGGQLGGYATSGTTISGTSDITFSSGQLTLGNSGPNAGSIILYGSTSGAATLNVPAAAGSPTFTLPSNNGTSGQFLTTNGSGVTSWTTPSSGGFTSQNVVTGSRAVNTVYQNTTGKTMFVTTTFNNVGSGGLAILSDSSSSPSTQIVGIGTVGGSGASLSFMVLNNNYYEASGTATVVHWTEWE